MRGFLLNRGQCQLQPPETLRCSPSNATGLPPAMSCLCVALLTRIHRISVKPTQLLNLAGGAVDCKLQEVGRQERQWCSRLLDAYIHRPFFFTSQSWQGADGGHSHRTVTRDLRLQRYSGIYIRPIVETETANCDDDGSTLKFTAPLTAGYLSPHDQR